MPPSLRPRARLAAAVLLAAAPAAARPAHAQAPGQAPAPATAGVIAGVVVDAASGAPVPAAQVRLVGLGRAELTHDDGRFDFGGLRPGTYRLAVQRIGYATAEQVVTLAAGGRAALRVPVAPSAARLSPVVVTGNVGEGRERDALRPTRVVGGAELDRRLGETVAATLLSQPGVTISSLGPATARPVIRGLSGDRVLVLEDGIRPGDLSSTSADHAVAVDPLTARQLEVVRGPNSLLYGPSALGGVVNVVRDEVPTSPLEHAHGSATAQAASVNRGRTAGGFVALPFGHVGGGHLAFRAEGSARTGGDLRTPARARSQHRPAHLQRLREPGAGRASAGTRASRTATTPTTTASRAASSARTPTASTCACGAAPRAPRRAPLRRRRDARARRAARERARDRGFTDYGPPRARGVGRRGHALRPAARPGRRGGPARRVGPVRVGRRRGARAAPGRDHGRRARTPSTDDVSAAAFVVEEAALGRVRLQGGVRYDYARYAPREREFVRVGDEMTPTDARTFGA
jgi:iron complex outermembrane receptor protein